MKTLLLILAIAGYVGLLSGEDAQPIKSAMNHEHSKAVFFKRQRSRIVGGQNAAVGQFPFTTAMMVDGSFHCTSSLLSHQWIITAAHCCTVDSSTVRVILGMTNLKADEESGMTVLLRKIVVNPSYSNRSISSDIALLMMATSVTYTTKIQPVSLPTHSMLSNNFAGSKVRTIGWGVSDDYPTQGSPILNYVDMEVITQQECKKTFYKVDDTIICTRGNGKKSPCSGDSGGPLVINYNTSSPVLIGVTDFGSGDCWSGDPAGFARVTYNLDWIHETTGIVIQS